MYTLSVLLSHRAAIPYLEWIQCNSRNMETEGKIYCNAPLFHLQWPHRHLMCWSAIKAKVPYGSISWTAF